jgi:hypothetical protein
MWGCEKKGGDTKVDTKDTVVADKRIKQISDERILEMSKGY